MKKQKVFEWEVYGPITGNSQPLLGTVLTEILDVGKAGQVAKRLFPQAAAVWLVGGAYGGTI
jgi:hypothetical protein